MWKLLLRGVVVAGVMACLPFNARAESPRDGSHDFDFASGTWHTHATKVLDPFDGGTHTVVMDGTKTARPVWNGKAWLEEIEADGPNGHWEAANLFLYDPAAHQWSQNYVDSSDGRFDGSPGIGELRGARLEFYWQARIGGRAMLERGIWADFTPTSHTYRVERSNDGGRTWRPSFIAHLTKIK